MARVLIIAHYTRSLINFRGELIKALAERGHEIFAAGPETGFEEEIRKLGASFVHIHLQRTGVNPLKDLSTFLGFLRIIEGMHPDVVFSYAVKPVIYGSIAAGLKRVPHIYSLITGLGYAFAGENFKQKFLRKGTISL